MAEGGERQDLNVRVRWARQKIADTAIRRVFEAGRTATSLLGQTSDSFLRDQLEHMVTTLDDAMAELRFTIFLLGDAPTPPVGPEERAD